MCVGVPASEALFSGELSVNSRSSSTRSTTNRRSHLPIKEIVEENMLRDY